MAKEQNLVIDQNSKFEYTVQVQGVTLPMTGWTARMEIADQRGEGGIELATYDTSTPGNNYLAVVAGAGQVQVNIPSAVTNAYTWRDAVYDLYAVEPGGSEGHRILQGRIRVSAKVK